MPKSKPHMAEPIKGLDNPRILAYLAGVLDGNGGRIVIQRTRVGGAANIKQDSYALLVAVCTTDAPLIDYLEKTLGGNWAWNNRNTGSRKWRCYGENAEALVRAVRPYLVRRAPHAETVLAFRELHHRYPMRTTPEVNAAREIMWRRIRSLDSNGRIPWPTEPLVIPPARTPKQAAKDQRAARLTDEQRAAAAAAYADGATIAVLAERYGVSTSTIARAVRRHGVATRPRGPRPATLTFDPAAARDLVPA